MISCGFSGSFQYPFPLMSHIENITEISAPPEKVFDVVSNLTAWPRYLPHYRWIRVMENHPHSQIVRMACYRGCLPIDWVSRFHADRATKKLYFEHLKAFTKGMKVVWDLDPIGDGTATRVTIRHEMEPVKQRWGSWITDHVIGGFFIDYIATRTLRNFRKYFEP